MISTFIVEKIKASPMNCNFFVFLGKAKERE
jgi:hypothetical protein